MTHEFTADPRTGAPFCPMEPLVEADRDGRLGERERASLVRHLASCASCQSLERTLERLALLSRAPLAVPLSQLERQRGRVRILRDGVFTPARPAATPMRRWSMGLAVAAVLGFAAIAAGRSLFADASPTAGAGTADDQGSRGALHGASSAAPRTETTVEANAGTRWRWSLTGPVDVVLLEAGTLEIGVRPLLPGERFLVRTEDAELEVHGTRFRVTADANRLSSVTVFEGRVELRCAGTTSTLGPGEAWQARTDGASGSSGSSGPSGSSGADAARGQEAAPAPAAPVVGGSSSTAPSSGPASPDASGRAPLGDHRVHGATPPAVSAAKKPIAPTTKLDEGIELIEQGNYGAAVDRLHAFQQQHPADARAQDAAFLAVIALDRAGRRAAAAAAARDYLARYPKGDRRAEAEAIVARSAGPR